MSEWVIEDRGYVTPCHVWQGYIGPQGYGMRRWRGQPRGAHVAAYERAKGPVPRGLVVDHLCEVPACVNAEHMEAVTQGENVRRAARPRKLTLGQIEEIRRSPGPQTRIAMQFGISQAHVSNLKRGRTHS